MTTEEIFELMRRDKSVRRAIVKRSHKFFFYYYFSHYIEHPIAQLHEELFYLTEQDNHSMMVISAFRNSGKSTLLSLSFPIWSIINNKAKYILIISENQQKAQTLLSHIREELTDNELLKRDLGPFREERFGWNSVSLTIDNYHSKITAMSTEQSVRGLRFRNHRPDLIILDDCESQDFVRKEENRNKLSSWLSGDVIPAGHTYTKIVVIGSMLHVDSLIPRLQKSIDDKKINGIYKMYPIVDDSGRSLWPGKYPDPESIEREKARGITDQEWSVEFMLRPMLDKDRIIKDEYIHYYDREPNPKDSNYRYAASGVDLAISESDTADYTAIVQGAVVKGDDDWQLYILPYPVNERLNGPEIEDRIVAESLKLGNGTPTVMYIESQSFQKSMIDFVQQRGIPAEGVTPGGTDKRARLISISALIRSGRVLFPKKGAEKLINQLLFFGTGHDDLVDALIYLVLKISEREQARYTVPRPGSYTPPPQGPANEQEADREISAKQEFYRGGPDPARDLLIRDQEARRRAQEYEASRQEEKDFLSKAMRKY